MTSSLAVKEHFNMLYYSTYLLFLLWVLQPNLLGCIYSSPISGPWRDCQHVLDSGETTSGIYLLRPQSANRLLQAWCEQSRDQGGWTVIQRRQDGSVNFFRTWEQYKVIPHTCTSAKQQRKMKTFPHVILCVAARLWEPRWRVLARPGTPVLVD